MLSPFPVALRRTGVRFLGIPFPPGTWGLRYLRPAGGQCLRGSGAVRRRGGRVDERLGVTAQAGRRSLPSRSSQV
jgi:hypothetical protein